MTDTSAQQIGETPEAALSPEQARAKGQELTAAADGEKDPVKRRSLNDQAQQFFASAAGDKTPAPPGQERADNDSRISEMSGGALTYEQVEVICRDAGPWSRLLENALVEKGRDAYFAEIDKGEAEVLRTIYRGYTGALKTGLTDILTAINQTFGDKASMVIEEIDQHAALANARSHDQILTWARAVLKPAPQR